MDDRRVKVGVVGYKGYIGTHVGAALCNGGREVSHVELAKVDHPPGDLPTVISSWRRNHSRAWNSFCESLEGLDVVLNAAGAAKPSSSDWRELWSANCLLPALVGSAAHHVGIKRMLHVSSAAVQGYMDPLTEDRRYSPFSSYSRSKMMGENALLERTVQTPDDVVIYRPTSVVGPTRNRTLLRLLASPWVPVPDPTVPIPLAHVENVAAAAALLVDCPSPPEVALHPSEAMTVRRLRELAGNSPHGLQLPHPVFRFALRARRLHGPDGVQAFLRKIDLVVNGQRIEARALIDRGYQNVVSDDCWTELLRAKGRP